MSNLHVLFQVGEADYVVSAALVSEMESFSGVTRVPGAPAHVLGLVQIRGRVLPLVDLRIRFGLPRTQHDLGARVIVVRDGDRLVGLLADQAREVVRIDAATFRPPPAVVSEQAAGYVDAVAVSGERLVMRIDVNKVVGNDAIPMEARDGTQA
jgi:purine-binding chemotaxis protein CheW